MAKKINVNLNVPEELLAELSAAMESLKLHSKQKWVVVSAALLLMIEAPEWRREEVIDAVLESERKGYGPLITEAKRRSALGAGEIELDIAPSGANRHPRLAAGESSAAPAPGKERSRESSRLR